MVWVEVTEEDRLAASRTLLLGDHGNRDVWGMVPRAILRVTGMRAAVQVWMHGPSADVAIGNLDRVPLPPDAVQVAICDKWSPRRAHLPVAFPLPDQPTDEHDLLAALRRVGPVKDWQDLVRRPPHFAHLFIIRSAICLLERDGRILDGLLPNEFIAGMARWRK